MIGSTVNYENYVNTLDLEAFWKTHLYNQVMDIGDLKSRFTPKVLSSTNSLDNVFLNAVLEDLPCLLIVYKTLPIKRYDANVVLEYLRLFFVIAYVNMKLIINNIKLLNNSI